MVLTRVSGARRHAAAARTASGCIFSRLRSVAMLRRKIPNTDLEVSPLCLGTMTFGNPVEEERAIAMVSPHPAAAGGAWHQRLAG